jgi:PTS system mannose-specific IIB component/fructoselysine and glucoselysine-specific PTS system IIB component
MTLELFRVDERLIHGQVVVGWGTRLGLRYYVVVDDALADSQWEQDLYRSGLPDGVRAEFVTTEEAIRTFEDLDAIAEPGALLTRGTATMRALAESGALEGRRVNLGGLHGGGGRERILDYLYLGPTERADLAMIASKVLKVSARDLPTAPEVRLDHLGS